MTDDERKELNDGNARFYQQTPIVEKSWQDKLADKFDRIRDSAVKTIDLLQPDAENHVYYEVSVSIIGNAHRNAFYQIEDERTN